MSTPREARGKLLDALATPSTSTDQLGELTCRLEAQLHDLAERRKRITALEQELAAARDELAPPRRARTSRNREVGALTAARSVAGHEPSLEELALLVERAARELSGLGGESEKLRNQIDLLERVAETAREHRLEMERRAQAEQSGLEADLDATRAERTKALEQLSSAKVASHTNRKRLEAELDDLRALKPRLLELEEAGRAAQAALAELRDQKTALASELESTRSESAETHRRLALRDEELQATVQNLIALEASTSALSGATEGLRAESTALRADRAELVQRLDILTQHAEGLARAVADREQTASELRSVIAAFELDIARRESRARSLEAEIRELAENKRRALELEEERAWLVAELRRVAASRAWRWGHGTTRILRRLTFRPAQKVGGVEKMLDRLQRNASSPTPAADEPRSETR